MNKTAIAWTDRTWNPVTGCTPISEGCEHCYCRAMEKRFKWPTAVTLHPERLQEPVKLVKPSKVFVCSMSDLFHEDVPDEYIGRVLSVISNSAGGAAGVAGQGAGVLVQSAGVPWGRASGVGGQGDGGRAMLTEAALAQLNEIARTWNTILTIQTRFERADAAMRHLPDLLAEVAALRERAELAEGALRAGDENQRLQLAALGMLDRFAPSCDLADKMGEALLSAEQGARTAWRRVDEAAERVERLTERAEAVEAENERLRDALAKINSEVHPGIGWIGTIARAALARAMAAPGREAEPNPSNSSNSCQEGSGDV